MGRRIGALGDASFQEVQNRYTQGMDLSLTLVETDPIVLGAKGK